MKLNARARPAFLFAAGCAGLTLSCALLFSWDPVVRLATLPTIILLVLGWLVFSAIAMIALHRTAHLWSNVTPTRRALWVAAAVAFGWIVSWMVPFQPAPGDLLEVEVRSLASHSPASQGSEVWARLLVDGHAVSLDDVTAGPTWIEAHGYLISPINSPADQLRWRGTYTSDVQLELFTHGWSGKAVVGWNGVERHLDLYSPEGGNITLKIAGRSESVQFLGFPKRTLFQYFVQFCQAISVGIVTLIVLLAAARWPSPTPVGSSTQQRIGLGLETLMAALPLLLVGSGFLYVFFPAILTADSLNQWAQAANGNYNDAHPLLFTLYLKLVQQLGAGPSLAAWLQMAAMAFAVGWLAAVVRRACSAPVWTSVLGGLLVAAYPLTSITSITLWKDVPYASTVVALTALVVGNITLGRPDLRRLRNCILLVLLAAACMLLRHNGPPVAAAAFLLLFIRPGTRVRVLACLMAAVAVTWSVKGPLADHVGTERTSAAYMVYTHHLSAHLAAGQRPQSSADAAILDAIDQGDEDWRYRCAVVNSTIFDKAYDIPTAVAHQNDLLRMWLEMAVKRPDVELRHVLCASGMVWRYRTTNNGPLYLYTFGFRPGPGDSLIWIEPGLSSMVESSAVPAAASRLGRALLNPGLQRYWRPAPFLVALVLLGILGWLRSGDRRILLVPSLVLVHSAVLMVAIIAQDARYQLPLYLVCLTVAPALVTARRPGDQGETACEGRAAG